MTVEQKQNLFSLFTNLKSKKSVNKHGIGLGLSQCKKITEEFGGHIYCTSQLNKGTKFTVDLPVSVACIMDHDA